MNNSILIIGKPHSSKTVFLAQFYIRLQKQKSKLRLYKPVENLTVINPAITALTEGLLPDPTHAEHNAKFVLPIKFEDNSEIDLLCPEYGGEQVNSIVRNRELDKQWSEAVVSSDNWLLFIRLNGINKAQDIADITPNENNITPEPGHLNLDHEISDQASFIELLQILLFHKNHDSHFLNKKIKLTVVLTCWDELDGEEVPSEQLKKELPLLYNFIDANWSRSAWTVLGLSALEFPLSSPENQEQYSIKGPESFGFIINESGQKNDDITELIIKAVQ